MFFNPNFFSIPGKKKFLSVTLRHLLVVRDLRFSKEIFYDDILKIHQVTAEASFKMSILKCLLNLSFYNWLYDVWSKIREGCLLLHFNRGKS